MVFCEVFEEHLGVFEGALALLGVCVRQLKGGCVKWLWWLWVYAESAAPLRADFGLTETIARTNNRSIVRGLTLRFFR